MTSLSHETPHWNSDKDSLARFLSAIVESLHAMAQPLTVLQATLELTAHSTPSRRNYQKAIEESLIQVARVVDQMGFAQELLRILQNRSTLNAVDVSKVMAVVEEDVHCALEDAGIALVTTLEEDIPLILASDAALRQCLFYLLVAAIEQSSPGKSIKVHVCARGEEAQIGLCTDGVEDFSGFLGVSVASPCKDRSLLLAEALAVAQGGNLVWRLVPFATRITLRTAPSKAIGNEGDYDAPDRTLTNTDSVGTDSWGPARV